MAVRRKRNYWDECAPSVGYGSLMGFMVGGGMAGIAGMGYAMTPGLRGQRLLFIRSQMPGLVLKGGGAFACFLGFGALIRCL